MRFIKLFSRTEGEDIYVRTDRIIKVTPSKRVGSDSLIHLDTEEVIEVAKSMVQVVGLLEAERHEKL
jgi:hypothetical protein